MRTITLHDYFISLIKDLQKTKLSETHSLDHNGAHFQKCVVKMILANTDP